MTREEKREYDRKYYQNNKDKILAKQRKYYLEHADERKVYLKEYRLDHADERREYQNQYNKTKGGRALNLASSYSKNDKDKGFDASYNITRDWLVQNIFSGQKCIYCGDSDWTHLGCDRIDNSKPHTPDNVVCCCEKCNKQRGYHYTVEEFKEMKELERIKNELESA